jgi:hypothetical protein
LVEHFHGKEGVIGSSPIEGFGATAVTRVVANPRVDGSEAVSPR